MKIEKYTMPLGMVGVVLFVVHTLWGNVLWPAYNPMADSVWMLTAQEAPNAHLLRLILGLAQICLLLFMLGMVIFALRNYRTAVSAGYLLLFLPAAYATLSYQVFPVTMDVVLRAGRPLHVTVMALLLLLGVGGMAIAGIGYLRQERLRTMGYAALCEAGLFCLFSLVQLVMLPTGAAGQGLIQRLTLYSALAWLFFLSAAYTSNSRLTRRKTIF